MTFGGAPARWEPSGASRGVALVAPGRAYSPSAPLLEFSRRALLHRVCPNCLKENHEFEANFCSACGTPLRAEPS